VTPRRIAIIAPTEQDGVVGGSERFGRSLAMAFARAGREVVHVRVGLGADLLEHGVRWLSLAVEPDEVDPWMLAKPRLAHAVLDVLRGCDEVHVLRFDAPSIDLVPRLAEAMRTRLWLHDHGASCARAFRHEPPSGSSCPSDATARVAGEETCARCIEPWIERRDESSFARLRGALASRRAAAALALSRAHELLAPSRAHARALMAVHGGLRLRVVEPGVESCFLDAGRAAAKAPAASASSASQAGLRILHAGNHGWWKGSCDLLDALDADLEAGLGADATLVLAGCSVDARWTERLARGSSRARIERHGAYSPTELARLAASCDVAVFPSRLAESYGLAAAECGAAGLELVVSDQGDLPSRVGDDASLVVASGDVRTLARMLARLAADKRAGRLRRGAQRRARGIDDCARELLD
jgi:glycosyltransferase involved in cell wall biosynthesis